MAGIIIDHNTCVMCLTCVSTCPFSALENNNNQIEVNSNCKLCKACIGVCPTEAISIEQIELHELDNSFYKGIVVYVEHEEGNIQNITYELINKARELAAKVNHKVYCVFIGNNIIDKASTLLEYGVDEVYVYQDKEYADFRVDNYSLAFEDALETIKPTVVLFGATTVGRSLAPTLATRFKTGLTADTTSLIMRENTDLVQIRPAFGGNIMAQILTANTRPQFATVRDKVFDKANKMPIQGKIVVRDVNEELIKSRIKVLGNEKMPPTTDISLADVVVCIGNGVKSERMFNACKELADLLGGVIACSRPVVERGLLDNSHQIGLSGRTVKPKLIMCIGVSGAIQFVNGMQNAETIISINKDPEANINNIAHYAVIGDINEIVPQLVELIRGN